MAKEKLPDLSLDELQEYRRLEEKWRANERLAENLKLEAAPIKEKIAAHVKAKGGKKRACVHHGHVLAETSMGCRPDWKAAYIGEAGAEAATKLQENTEPTYRLEVREVAEVA